MPTPVLIVHGGAGPRRARPDGRADDEVRRALACAIGRGWRQLHEGAEAACVAAVSELEDCLLFNAATGSALAADGGVWCDASLMCDSGRAGAVAAVQGIRHPVLAAQALARADHHGPLLWAGRSSELAELHGLELRAAELMVTERQRRRLDAHRSRRHDADRGGTVGAVCLDAGGRMAAATSTGGYCGKPPARVGDSAILGAGTWAHPLSCAVSATGDGEAFMRVLFAHVIHARMLHGEDLATAADAALGAVGEAGGRGGAICVDARGTIAMPVSSDVMYRAWRRDGDATMVALGAFEEGCSLERMLEFRPCPVGEEPAATLVQAMRDEMAALYDGLQLDGADMPKAGPQELSPPGGTFVVGFEDGIAVCCGGLKQLSEGACEIKKMFVVEAARGRGIARALLAELERRARALGYAVARLDTGPKQTRAQQMYVRAGYGAIANFNANPVATFFGEKRL